MSSYVRKPNRLAKEKSPYLSQHGFNPVDWYPWSEEAFVKAEKEDKPIFLSIGYSACHWCHVMEKESFEDEEVAGILNESFVAVKVDREERPDIDNRYMNACILFNGSGGWPLTIFMTPRKQPFFAGTYFPKSSRSGMTGLVDLLKQVAELWKKDKTKLVSSAEKTVELLRENALTKLNGEELDQTTLDEGFVDLLEGFDSANGGFGTRPKFPIAINLLFLLRYWRKKGRLQALNIVEKTLQKIRQGGIFDQVGFGFHRYSTDSTWLVPHFEKMLYDQALICMAYVETYQATGKPEYQKVAEEILDYILRDMSDPEGGLYSSEDADSEGQEGKFYLWIDTEIRELLGRHADLMIRVFNVQRKGNYYNEARQRKTGKNILHLNEPLQELAVDFGLGFEELSSIFEESRRKLFEAREKRARPLKDTKILTDWNGLMIAALAKSARAFNQPRYAGAAERSVKFIIEKLQVSDGRLKHRYKDGEAAIIGNLDDYAFVIWGLIELYETTFELRYLTEALRLQHVMIKHFWDGTDGGFYFTSDDDEKILIRSKEFHDSAIPSGNAVALLNLIRLTRMTGDIELEEKTEELKKAFVNLSADNTGNTMLLSALDFVAGPAYEVVIVGDPQSQTTKETLRTMGTKFIPNKTVLFKSENDEQLEKIAEYTKNMKTINNKTTIYVCSNFTCNKSTNDIDQALEAINK